MTTSECGGPAKTTMTCVHLWPSAPAWGRLPAIVLALVCAAVLPAAAQPKNKRTDKNEAPSATDPARPGKGAKADGGAKGDAKGGDKGGVKNFDFTGLDLNGRMRTPQLLYFLERANEELERASLEKRSFIPHMVRTVEEEAL